MAATKLSFPKLGIIHRLANLDMYDKTMDVYLKRSDNIPIQGGRFYKEETATTLSHKITTLGNVLNTPRKSDNVDPLPHETPAPGYNKEFVPITYRNAVRITRTMDKIDQSGQARWLMAGLPDSGRRLLEFAYADPINNGTTTEGADGSYLFSNDHYHEDPAGGTWSNIETAAALTTTSLNTAGQNMRKRKNEKGMVSPIMLKELVVPPDLAYKAAQIVGSPKVAESSLEGINPWMGTKYSVWDHLTDTNGWLCVGDRPEDEWGLHAVFLTRFEVSKLAYPTATYPDIIAGYRLYGQFDIGASVPKNMHLNQGA